MQRLQTSAFSREASTVVVTDLSVVVVVVVVGTGHPLMAAKSDDSMDDRSA